MKKRRPLTSFQRKSILQYAGLGVLAVAVLFVVAFALQPKTAPVAEMTMTPEPAMTATPKVPRILVIGDSYTGGTDMGGKGDKNWTALVQRRMYATDKQRSDWQVTTLGGSGYVSAGSSGKTFGVGVEEPDNHDAQVAILFGSRNDVKLSEAQVAAAAPAAINRLKARNPAAKLIVIGPTWAGGEVPPALVRISNSIEAAAVAVGATFVDPLEQGWFLGPDASLIGTDGVHPTDEGNAYLAEKLLPVVIAALAK